MYLISKRMEVAYAHNLTLPYTSKCQNLHGHNGIVTVYCMSEDVDSCGMVIDFTRLKSEIHDVFDHNYANDVMGNVNPTAENMAKWICDKINNWTSENDLRCYKVTFQESEGNVAAYIEDKYAKLLNGLEI